MKRWLIAAATLLALVACDRSAPTVTADVLPSDAAIYIVNFDETQTTLDAVTNGILSAGAGAENPLCDGVHSRLGFVEVDDVDRRSVGNETGRRPASIGPCDWTALVASYEREQRACRDEPPLHGILGCQGHAEKRQPSCPGVKP